MNTFGAVERRPVGFQSRDTALHIEAHEECTLV